MVFGSRAGLLLGRASRPLLAARLPMQPVGGYTTFAPSVQQFATSNIRSWQNIAQTRGFAEAPAATVEEAKKADVPTAAPAETAKPKSSLGSR